MTIASALLALLTATSSPASDSNGPALLDFHAEWCGPCRQVRPAVEQLIGKGYPVKTIDIDQEPDLAQRYHVRSVPTFIVVDGSGRELDRSSGARSAVDLARFYKAAAAKAAPPANSNAHADAGEDASAGTEANDDQSHNRAKAARTDTNDRQQDDGEASEREAVNPKPWETVVRIRVLSKRSTGFGSGTIVHSTPEETLVLTCAHIFKVDGRTQAAPPEFPRRIMVDLFDGNLQGTKPAKVHFAEAVEGWAVDYDFHRDVGLIRIKPGRRLPACRVVPAHWQPEPRMQVLTVGCSEGHDATAWRTTITKARIQNFLQGNPTYEAIECDVAPKQGRSGGGLFTDDGYIAGVCNFAEPHGNHGLYATPRSIYKLLDRNNLMALYAPVSRGGDTLLADGKPAVRRQRKAGVAVARAQSPDLEDTARDRGKSDSDEITVPDPGRLGIPPIAAQSESTQRATSNTTRRIAWQPRPVHQRAEPTDLNLDPSADHDRFGPFPSDADREGEVGDREPAVSRPKPAATTVPQRSTHSRWRAVKVAQENQD